MKYILLIFLALLAINSFAQDVGDYDKIIRAKQTLQTDSIFTYRDSVVSVEDISFHQYSTDGNTWSKDTTGANYIRFSNDNQNEWLEFPIGDSYWTTLSGVLLPSTIEKLFTDTINASRYNQGGVHLKVSDLSSSDGTEGQVAINRSGVPTWEDFPSGIGETNYAENAGTSGTGIYSGKDGVKFVLRNIAGGDAIDVTLAADSVIELSFDGSERSVATSTMLSGGGDLSVNRTLSLSINSGVSTTSIDADNDWLVLFDVSAGTHYKIHPSDITGFAYVDSVYSEIDDFYGTETLSYDIGGSTNVITTMPFDDGINTGGIVTWQSGLIFNVSPCSYYINGDYFTTDTEVKTLDASDPTNPRLDVIAVDSLGAVVIIKGVAASSPQKPSIDPISQIELTYILVEAGATVGIPPISTIADSLVYNENVEWTTSATGVTVDFDYTTTVYTGSVAANVSTIETGDKLIFESAYDVSNSFNNVSFFIKLKTASVVSGRRLYATCFSDNVAVSNQVLFQFDTNNTDWQIVTVSSDEFAFTNTTFDEIRLEFSQWSGTAFDGFYFDYMKVQGGFYQPSASDADLQTVTTNGNSTTLAIETAGITLSGDMELEASQRINIGTADVAKDYLYFDFPNLATGDGNIEFFKNTVSTDPSAANINIYPGNGSGTSTIRLWGASGEAYFADGVQHADALFDWYSATLGQTKQLISDSIVGISPIWLSDAYSGAYYISGGVGIGRESDLNVMFTVIGTRYATGKFINTSTSSSAIEGVYAETNGTGATKAVKGLVTAGGQYSVGVLGSNTSTTTSEHYGLQGEALNGSLGYGVIGKGGAADVMAISSGLIGGNEIASTPSTPPSGKWLIYTKTDGLIYTLDDTGTERSLTATGSGGDMYKVGTPVNNQIGIWTGDGTMEGDATLTYDGFDLGVTGGRITTGTYRAESTAPEIVFTDTDSDDWELNMGNEYFSLFNTTDSKTIFQIQPTWDFRLPLYGSGDYNDEVHYTTYFNDDGDLRERPITPQTLATTGSFTMDVQDGLKGSISAMTGDITLTLSNLEDGMEGTIDLTNGSTAYSFNLNGSSGYTIEQAMGDNSDIDATVSSHTTVIYWRTGNILYYGFIHEN